MVHGQEGGSVDFWYMNLKILIVMQQSIQQSLLIMEVCVEMVNVSMLLLRIVTLNSN